MAIDWSAIEADAIQAAEGVLTGVWPTVANGATAAVSSLVQAARYIGSNLTKMTANEGKLLISQQKAAMENVLLSYESIDIAVAINAVSAVMAVITNAVPALMTFA